MATTLKFVTVDSGDAAAARLRSAEHQRLVRAQAMRASRRWQRELQAKERSSQSKAHNDTYGGRPRRKHQQVNLNQLHGSNGSKAGNVFGDATKRVATLASPDMVVAAEDIMSTTECSKIDTVADQALAVTTVDSPSTYRSGMITAFVDGYFPRDRCCLQVVGATLGHWLVPKAQSMQAGNDAVALLQMGAETGDQRILLEGRKRHLFTVQLIQLELESSNARLDGVLGSTMELLICEVYKCVSVDPDAWRKQIPGISALISDRRHQEQHSTFYRWLFRTFRVLSLVQGLVSRRDVTPTHHYLPVKAPPGTTGRLIQLSLHLPALIEAADKSKNCETPNQGEIIQVQRQLETLEQQFLHWLSDYYLRINRATRNDECQYPKDTNCSLFRSAEPENADPLPKALGFRSILDATYHVIYWTCLLVLRESLLDLSKHRFGAFPSKERNMIAEIDECADLLCESIPYLTQAAEGVVLKAFAVSAPLHFSARWFRRTDAIEKLVWCDRVAGLVQAQAPYLQWEALLPWSFFAVAWICPVEGE